MSQLKVLIVDDSLITVKKLTAMLETLGHRVIGTAGTGARALEEYRALKPDMVTMDITMPDMDGVEATRRIVREFPEAIIIMVTSHGQEKMVLDALDAGAQGYVLKPVRPEKLAEMIAKVMTRLGRSPA
jgi:two-component system chemotaxis response regulator CheY